MARFEFAYILAFTFALLFCLILFDPNLNPLKLSKLKHVSQLIMICYYLIATFFCTKLFRVDDDERVNSGRSQDPPLHTRLLPPERPPLLIHQASTLL